MCQFGTATGAQMFGLTAAQMLLGRYFLEVIHIQINRLRKHDALFHVGGLHSIS